MGNYNVGNETKNGSRCVCKWKGVVCLAGILISLVVGVFYGLQNIITGRE